MMSTHVRKDLDRKDHIIRDLEQQNDGLQKQSKKHINQNQILRDKINDLEAKLLREQENNELKAANKKLLRLQKERAEQDKQMDKLNVVIKKLQLEQGKFIQEQVNMKDENKTHELNKKFQEETIRKEKE